MKIRLPQLAGIKTDKSFWITLVYSLPSRAFYSGIFVYVWYLSTAG